MTDHESWICTFTLLGMQTVLRRSFEMIGSQPAPGTVAFQLWVDTKVIADQSLANPFVRALGEGSLPR
jgi:hypothetical protein